MFLGWVKHQSVKPEVGLVFAWERSQIPRDLPDTDVQTTWLWVWDHCDQPTEIWKANEQAGFLFKRLMMTRTETKHNTLNTTKQHDTNRKTGKMMKLPLGHHDQDSSLSDFLQQVQIQMGGAKTSCSLEAGCSTSATPNVSWWHVLHGQEPVGISTKLVEFWHVWV